MPENFKKFISGKINEWFYKKCTLADFINGSRASRVCREYKGVELGTSVLNIQKNEVLYFNGKHYEKTEVPYLKQYDNKKDNIQIVQESVCKNVKESVCKNVQKNVQKKCKEDMKE